MKNKSIESIRSKVKIAIKGKNVNRFLLRLYKHKIAILDLSKVSKDEAYALIYFKDYEQVLKLSTIYDIYIVSYGGWEKNKNKIRYNRILLLSLFFAFATLFILSKLIFKVEVITNDGEMREQLLYDLGLYKIEKFKFQKSYSEIQKIKEELLIKYKEEIEWLEIELVGTKYILKYEPRIINEEENKSKPRHIIANKNAIIYSVISSKGQVIRYKNDYVKKGDVVVSGYIYLNDEIKDTVSAEGKIFGETWYEVEVFYPFGYYEQKRTGKEKDVYTVKFLNHKWELFNFNKFYDKIVEEKVILASRVIPLQLVKEHQIEVKTKSAIQTPEEAKEEAVALGVSKMENKLADNEYIIKYKVLDENLKQDGVLVRMFFSVCEDITAYEEIKEEKDAEDNDRGT